MLYDLPTNHHVLYEHGALRDCMHHKWFALRPKLQIYLSKCIVLTYCIRKKIVHDLKFCFLGQCSYQITSYTSTQIL